MWKKNAPNFSFAASIPEAIYDWCRSTDELVVWEAQGCATGRFEKLQQPEIERIWTCWWICLPRFKVPCEISGSRRGFHKFHSVLASVCLKHQRQSMMLHTQDGPEAANTTMADLEVWEDKLNKIFQLEAIEKSTTPLLWKKTWEKISFT